MIQRREWDIYISLINKGKFTIAFEHSKKPDRRVYIINIEFGSIAASCSYQAFRKYRKFLHSIPGGGCNRMH